jgi:altronate dehydratase
VGTRNYIVVLGVTALAAPVVKLIEKKAKAYLKSLKKGTFPNVDGLSASCCCGHARS